MVPHVQPRTREGIHVLQQEADVRGRMLHLVRRDGVDEADREEGGNEHSCTDVESGSTARGESGCVGIGHVVNGRVKKGKNAALIEIAAKNAETIQQNVKTLSQLEYQIQSSYLQMKSELL